MPLISVIVTCYNVAEYLERCLDSVVNQSLRDIEIIVVDDGSTDGTRDIIERYVEADPRVRSILFAENAIGGVASAANAGLDAATGEFVGFVDGDDFIELKMFERMWRAASADGSDLAMCKYLEFDENTGQMREPAERRSWAGLGDSQVLTLDTPERVIEILGFIAVPWRKIYSRALLEEHGIRFPVVDYAWEDNPFHWYTVCSARSISIVHDVLCYHRVGRGGQTMQARSAGFVRIFGHHGTIRDWLSQRGIVAQYEGALLSWAVSQYEWVVRRVPQGASDALYDALRPVVQSVSQPVLEGVLRSKLKGTGKMLRWVKADDRQSFLEEFDRRFVGERSVSREVEARLERGLAMFRLARENLRTHGVRNTVKKTLMQVGVWSRVRALFEPRKRRAVTDEQMLKFLAILQRENDRKHTELLERLREIERKLEEREAKNDR